MITIINMSTEAYNSKFNNGLGYAYWDYPVSELDYLLDIHKAYGCFVFALLEDGRLHEVGYADEPNVKSLLKEIEDGKIN